MISLIELTAPDRENSVCQSLILFCQVSQASRPRHSLILRAATFFHQRISNSMAALRIFWLSMCCPKATFLALIKLIELRTHLQSLQRRQGVSRGMRHSRYFECTMPWTRATSCDRARRVRTSSDEPSSRMAIISSLVARRPLSCKPSPRCSDWICL